MGGWDCHVYETTPALLVNAVCARVILHIQQLCTLLSYRSKLPAPGSVGERSYASTLRRLITLKSFGELQDPCYHNASALHSFKPQRCADHSQQVRAKTRHCPYVSAECYRRGMNALDHGRAWWDVAVQIPCHVCPLTVVLRRTVVFKPRRVPTRSPSSSACKRISILDFHPPSSFSLANIRRKQTKKKSHHAVSSLSHSGCYLQPYPASSANW